MKKIVIFGAGKIGKRAIKKYGRENVSFIIDNDRSLYGKTIEGLAIKNPDVLKANKEEYRIVIASKQVRSMSRQLLAMDITNFALFDINWSTEELVYNPYEDRITEDWNGQGIEQKIEDINEEVTCLREKKLPIFNHIEIETINRCNGSCSFCPVNKNVDPRPMKKMESDLFYKIIKELKSLDYTGSVVLFSNNEPFIDSRMEDFLKYTREHLKKAFLHIATNGTLLTLERFVRAIPYLDELIIDNYNQELVLNPNSELIAEYCEKHRELKQRVKIILRRPEDVLTSRGGDAPNCERNEKYPNASCLLPYKQIVIRPDGKVSLCCNDALGKCTMGDLTLQTLEEVWYGEAFERARKGLKNGRKNFERCKYCDTLFIC